MDPLDNLASLSFCVTGRRFVTVRWKYADGTAGSGMIIGDDAEEFTDQFRDRIRAAAVEQAKDRQRR
jgi:hypothetical protein